MAWGRDRRNSCCSPPVCGFGGGGGEVAMFFIMYTRPVFLGNQQSFYLSINMSAAPL